MNSGPKPAAGPKPPGGGYKKPPPGGVSNLGWSNDHSDEHTSATNTHVIVNTAGASSAAEAAKKVADMKNQGKYVDGYLNLGRVTPDEHKQMYNDIKQGLDAIGKSIGGVTRDPKGGQWAKERWVTPQAMADPKVRAVFEKAWAAEIARMGKQGFDAIQVDNVDYYQRGNGLPGGKDANGKNTREPTPAEVQQAAAIGANIANAIHKNGMAAGWKNAPEIAPQMASQYDFAVTEQMFQSGTGNKEWGVPLFKNFVDQGKPIYNFEVEQKYHGSVPDGWASYNKGGQSGYQQTANNL